MKDIYFEKNYGRLYEQIENGVCEVFEFHHPLGKVDHLFIKRPIPMSARKETFYDITTPYGYGGPRITGCKESDKLEVVEAFQQIFEEYCLKENIVSELVRFHPLFANAHDFESCYKLTFRRNTTGTNLKDFDDPIASEFSRSKQKSIQKALKAGVTYRIIVNPLDLDEFRRLYYETMTCPS